MCANKPTSQSRPYIGGPVRSSASAASRNASPPTPPPKTAGIWPKPCRQDSVTFDLSDATAEAHIDALRFTQDLIFGTDEHTDTYNALRQSQEGLHGLAKDDAYEALKTAQVDENGDFYVVRRKRTGEHATTHLPPGHASGRGDPADEDLTEGAA